MDTAIIKFLILWIIFENVMQTTCMALREITKEDANTREKRSPASLFGFNLGSPVSAAKETFSSIGNIFSGNRGNRHHNNYHEPTDKGGPYGNMRNTNTFSPVDIGGPYGNVRNTNTLSPVDISGPYGNARNTNTVSPADISGPYGNVRNTNTVSPIEFPSRGGIPNSITHKDFQKEDRYVWPQENTSEVGKSTVPESNNRNKNLHQQHQAPENTGHYQSNADIDKQLLEYIFQNQQFNNDPAGTTVDNNIDFVTETGEFETTTDLALNRILPQAAVASLLG